MKFTNENRGDNENGMDMSTSTVNVKQNAIKKENVNELDNRIHDNDFGKGEFKFVENRERVVVDKSIGRLRFTDSGRIEEQLEKAEGK
mmetsp:Transcript_39510/g.54858  ORF Transcript_39510/g.54858 Transcript_39510/m.54858 type:complete len:88 (-) Transcript_39510:14-277(-)